MCVCVFICPAADGGAASSEYDEAVAALQQHGCAVLTFDQVVDRGAAEAARFPPTPPEPDHVAVIM